MAIAHFSAQMIGGDRSPVAAAAYRHRTSMREHGVGTTFSYPSDVALVHEEIGVPATAPAWLHDLLARSSVAASSEALWNAVVDCETRCDGQYAREINIAMPIELSTAQNIELMRAFVATEFTARGLVVDWVFHNKPDNPHVHLMHTVRALDATGFGRKKVAVLDDGGRHIRSAKRLVYRPFIGGKEDFLALRQSWGATATRHLGQSATVERARPTALALAHALTKLQSQNISDFAHRCSLGGHRISSRGCEGPLPDSGTGIEFVQLTSGGGRHRRNGWPTCIGTPGRLRRNPQPESV